jgi:hypothetical protein
VKRFFLLSGGNLCNFAENQGQEKTDQQETLFSLLLGIE